MSYDQECSGFVTIGSEKHLNIRNTVRDRKPASDCVLDETSLPFRVQAKRYSVPHRRSWLKMQKQPI